MPNKPPVPVTRTLRTDDIEETPSTKLGHVKEPELTPECSKKCDADERKVNNPRGSLENPMAKSR
jgi:hypothetical protein